MFPDWWERAAVTVMDRGFASTNWGGFGKLNEKASAGGMTLNRISYERVCSLKVLSVLLSLSTRQMQLKANRGI